jgi:hypothetical protein
MIGPLIFSFFLLLFYIYIYIYISNKVELGGKKERKVKKLDRKLVMNIKVLFCPLVLGGAAILKFDGGNKTIQEYPWEIVGIRKT